MASNGSSPPVGLSLYASYINTSSGGDAPGTISAAPVTYKPKDGLKQGEAAGRSSINSASLQFQPTKRPQLQAQRPKAKAKPSVPLGGQPVVARSSLAQANPSIPAAQTVNKSTLADWAAEDEMDYYVEEKRERGGKRAKKKRAKNQATNRDTISRDWDDIYDLLMPTQYEEYRGSDEHYATTRAWKDRLYAHRRKKRGIDDITSSGVVETHSQIAPPSNFSFAPPKNLDPVETTPPPPPPVDVPDDATGEDAYTRRMRLSQQQQGAPITAVPPTTSPPFGAPNGGIPPPPPPTSTSVPPAPPPPAPVPISTTISRAPVRYNLPTPPPASPPSAAADEQDPFEQPEPTAPQPDEPADTPRSKLSGQAGFAQRYMAKHGWAKGQGLGADEEGITTALKVQVSKRKKKADAEGGGWAGPQIARIVGGKRAKEVEEGKFGKMSAVVVLRGMVAGLDVEKEMREGELMMDIGRSVEKYGRVERVYIDQYAQGEIPVFVKFTDQVSALNAVNALDGWTFNSNPVRARFFDSEKFTNGIYG
ncbi:MAG: hypothetical protein Q9165_000665 [Trypethelium subeluteriae]